MPGLGKEVLFIPNLLTLSRLFALPFLIAFWHQKYFLTALALFIIFALTDVLDGWLARISGKVSSLGKILDPLADKIYLLTMQYVALPSFLLVQWLVLIGVESVLAIMGLVAFLNQSGQIVLGANSWGKRKSTSEIFFAAFLLIDGAGLLPVPPLLLRVLLGSIIFLALLSIYGHLNRCLPFFFAQC